MREVKVGNIAYPNAAVQSPAFLVPVKNTLVALKLRLTGTVTVSTTITLVEDTIKNLLRRVEIRRGGIPFQTYGDNSVYGSGGKILFYLNKILRSVAPELADISTGAATYTIAMTIEIPFTYPKILGRNFQSKEKSIGLDFTAISPSKEDIEVVVDWGSAADYCTVPANAPLTNCSLEVIAVLAPEFDAVKNSKMLKFATQSLGISTGAGANTDDAQKLNAIGNVPAIFLLAINNGVKAGADAVYNNLDFKINSNVSILKSSWGYLKARAREVAQYQSALDDGVNFALFDIRRDLTGLIPVGNRNYAAQWEVSVDHAALTSVNRLYAGHLFVDDVIY